MSITVTLAGVDYEIPSPADSDDWGDAFNTFLLALAANSGGIPEPWVAPVFATGWSNNAVVGYSKQGGSSVVRFKGSGLKGNTGAGLICTLPVGYRPQQLLVIPVAASYSDAAAPYVGIYGAVLNIGTDGTVTLNLSLASRTTFGTTATIARLDGIAFLTI